MWKFRCEEVQLWDFVCIVLFLRVKKKPSTQISVSESHVKMFIEKFLHKWMKPFTWKSEMKKVKNVLFTWDIMFFSVVKILNLGMKL